jgi:hypothetical protein
MLELGLAERRDGDLILEESALGGLADEQTSVFRRTLRSLVLAAEHNSALWEHAEGEAWASTASREFSRIAVWFLEKPVGGLSDDFYEVARREVEGPTKLVENVEQWRVFIRWAEALGLMSRLGGLQLPDPTVAVEEELSGVFGSKSLLPALQVRDGLVSALPVLRNGAYASGFDRFLNQKPRRLASEAGPALAFALIRLERRGVIAFARPSDSDQLILSDPHSPDNPTRIKWEQAA